MEGFKLVGDSGCPNLLAVSVYDTKPVHFLFAASDSIKWVEKQLDVFDWEKQKLRPMKFLCLTINDKYNYGMGSTDIADQLRGAYWFDK